MLQDGLSGYYAFRIGSQPNGGFDVQREECKVIAPDALSESFFKVENGELTATSMIVAPPVLSDRLYLVAASGLPAFRPLYDALSHMGFYNLNPDVIREPQAPDPGQVLKRDGSNLASVLGLLQREHGLERIVNLLSCVVPGVRSVEVKHVGKKETLEFRQLVGSNKSPWRFMAENMSDGTLRALGVLTALFQSFSGCGRRVPLVGIEEPETGVHPGAAGVLRDALNAASEATQTLVTSHSPDLLDDKGILDEHLLTVFNRNGETVIGPSVASGRNAIRDRLNTAGERLRMSELEADEAGLADINPTQLELF